MLISNNRSHFYARKENVKEAANNFPSILFRRFFALILVGALTLVLEIRMAETSHSLVLFSDDSRLLILFLD